MRDPKARLSLWAWSTHRMVRVSNRVFVLSHSVLGWLVLQQWTTKTMGKLGVQLRGRGCTFFWISEATNSAGETSNRKFCWDFVTGSASQARKCGPEAGDALSLVLFRRDEERSVKGSGVKESWNGHLGGCWGFCESTVPLCGHF